MSEFETTIRKSYIDLRGINLGADFVKAHGLRPGQKYSLDVEGVDDQDTEGTLDKSGFIGGLSVMYKAFDLCNGDKVAIRYEDPRIIVSPPSNRRRQPEMNLPTAVGAAASVETPVFERQKLRHIYIEPFSPGNLTRWTPQTEPDVYMVFGALSEYTDFRYCCGTSKSLLERLGYSGDTKPDAILIARDTGQYLVAEFKMASSEFALNHSRELIDVLVCWEDNASDRGLLPPKVLCLKSLLENAVKEGEIDL